MSDKQKKEKIFLNSLDSWFSNFFIEAFRTDYLPESKLQTEFMGTINDTENLRLPKYFTPHIVNFDYDPGYKNEIFSNDIFIYNLNTGNCKEINYIIKGLKSMRCESEKILIIISNIMTWVRTPNKQKSDKSDEVIFIHPDDEIKEKPKTPEEKKELNENEGENNLEENNNKEENNEKKEENNEKKEENNNNNENKEENNNNAAVEDSKLNTKDNIENQEKVNENKEQEKENPVFVYYTEKDYAVRKPSMKYLNYKFVENEALSLNQKINVKTYIVCPGIIYGYGEKTFYSIFKNALLNLPIEEILLDKGRNIIPTIHMKDLISIISKIIEKKPVSHYLLAFDQTRNRSLKNIIKSIYNCVGDENKISKPKEPEIINQEENKENNENNNPENNQNNEQQPENENNEEKKEEEKKPENEEIIDNKKKQHPFFSNKKYILSDNFPNELLYIDLKLLPSDFLKGEPKVSYYSELANDNTPQEFTPLFKWHAPCGISSNFHAVRKEFLKYRNINNNKILILGNPYTGKTTISNILSKIFHLPIISSKSIADFGKKLIAPSENESNDLNEEFSTRKNSTEKDLIRDIQKVLKELEENRPAAEEEYNKRPNKKKNDPPFDDNMYYRFNDEMMVRILQRRLQENDTTIYGFILDGFPKNYSQANELFSELEKNNNLPNSVLIFNDVEDDYLINRLKTSEDFPKDNTANLILERASRRFTKLKEEKSEENYKSLHEYFNENEKINIYNIDTKKTLLEIIKETQEFIIKNNSEHICQLNDALDFHEDDYDYVKIEEHKNDVPEEEKKENNENVIKEENPIENNVNQENKKETITVEESQELNKKLQHGDINSKEGDDTKMLDQSKTKISKEDEKSLENEKPKTQLEIEKENEFKLLEKKSEVLRRYLAENVLPLLSLGILHVATERPEDPVEALADFLLSKTFEEKEKDNEKGDKNLSLHLDTDDNIHINGEEIKNNEVVENIEGIGDNKENNKSVKPLSPINRENNIVGNEGNVVDELNKVINDIDG